MCESAWTLAVCDERRHWGGNLLSAAPNAMNGLDFVVRSACQHKMRCKHVFASYSIDISFAGRPWRGNADLGKAAENPGSLLTGAVARCCHADKVLHYECRLPSWCRAAACGCGRRRGLEDAPPESLLQQGETGDRSAHGCTADQRLEDAQAVAFSRCGDAQEEAQPAQHVEQNEQRHEKLLLEDCRRANTVGQQARHTAAVCHRLQQLFHAEGRR
jgi:hypothetical protein